MTIPRTQAQESLHALLCKRHTKDVRLRQIVRQAISERLQAMRGVKP